jgi:hypothetical protein
MAIEDQEESQMDVEKAELKAIKEFGLWIEKMVTS